MANLWVESYLDQLVRTRRMCRCSQMCGPEPLTPTAATLQMRLGSFQNQQQAIHGHEVVDADKHLFANFYVRAGWCACAGRGVGECITLPSATQVSQILSMKEDDIVTAWEKANISAGRRLAERDYRLSYILWRVWFLRRKKAQVEFEEAQRSSCAATDLEPVR